MSAQWAVGDNPLHLTITAKTTKHSIRAKSDGAVSPEEKGRMSSALTKPAKSEGNRRAVNPYMQSEYEDDDGGSCIDENTAVAAGSGGENDGAGVGADAGVDADADAVSEDVFNQVVTAASLSGAPTAGAGAGILQPRQQHTARNPQLDVATAAKGRRMSGFGADTTTTLPAAAMIKVLKRALASESISYTQPHPLKLVCETRTVPTTNAATGLLHRKKTMIGKLVKWEMELCELERPV